MKGIYKALIFILVIVLVVIIIVVIKNTTVKASNGGILEGNSHEDGGIKTKVIGLQRKIVVEGGEDVLTKNVNSIKEIYRCEGTPQQIASEINKIGGGINFANGGKCYKI